MANLEVNLTKRVPIKGKGLRFCRVVIANNGRVKPDYVRVDGLEQRITAGAYYIEWREGSRRIRLNVGTDAQAAQAQQRKKVAELQARAHGVAVVPTNGNGARPTLTAAIAEYMHRVRLTKKPKTIAAYKVSLDYFQKSCTRVHVDEITDVDMLDFTAYLRNTHKLSARSVANKFENVMSFLKKHGINTTRLVDKSDRPKYTEETPEIFEQEELNKIFGACNDTERVWFEFFLKTGMREQEVMYCYWRDVDLNAAVVRVTHKPDRGWTPKAYKEREIPIPNSLVMRLKAFKVKADKNCSLVFPTKGCRPKQDFLDCLKAVAKKAGLDPRDCWLHKFRATFATRALWAGVDLSTVQAWMGHSDLASTMRYLRPQRHEDVREKVNSIFEQH